MKFSIPQIIIIISMIPILLSGCYALFLYKRLDRNMKPFAWFLFVALTLHSISQTLWFMVVNNLWLVHIYTPLSFVMLAWFYKRLLNGFINGRIIDVVSVGFVAFSLVNTLFFQPFMTYNSNAVMMESTLLIILSLSTYLFFLNDIVKGTHKDKLSSLHWINSGIFIYNSSSLLLFYFADFLNRNLPVTFIRYTWAAHSFFSIVMYICFFIGLWKGQRKSASSLR